MPVHFPCRTRFAERSPGTHAGEVGAARKSAILGLFAMAAASVAAPAAPETVAIYAIEDAFVMEPGPGNEAAYWDGASRNFGGMRSRHVAAADAHPGGDPLVPSKGEFLAVACFQPSNAVAQLDARFGVGRWRISGLALSMTVSDYVPGPGLFNAPGSSGRFRASWMPYDGDWSPGAGYINQGDTSHNPDLSPANFEGITYTSLHAALDAHPAEVLDVMDVVNSGVLIPVTNSLAATNAAFLATLVDANPVTLLFDAADDHVAFNFTSHLYSEDRDTNAYTTAVQLTAEPLPPASVSVHTDAGLRFLEVRFPRLAGVTGLTYAVLASSDLVAGDPTWLAGASNGLPMAGPGFVAEAGSVIVGVSDVTVRDTAPIKPGIPRFLILHIER